jgi:putative ABC transport system substrate-binding protein
MRRRSFIKVPAGLAVALPFAVRAQQPERVRRIGVLLAANADDVEFQTWVGAQNPLSEHFSVCCSWS